MATKKFPRYEILFRDAEGYLMHKHVAKNNGRSYAARVRHNRPEVIDYDAFASLARLLPLDDSVAPPKTVHIIWYTPTGNVIKTVNFEL